MCTAEQRWQMTHEATVDLPWCTASRVDLDRPGPTYAVDTIRCIASNYVHPELTLILGADSYQSLPGWSQVDELVSLVQVAVCRRAPFSTADDVVPRMRKVLIDNPDSQISSTECRRRIRLGLSLTHLVPARVRHFIADCGLYQSHCNQDK